MADDLTLAQHDAAVYEHEQKLRNEWFMSPVKIREYRDQLLDDVIAAAEARGAARERGRTCEWPRVDADSARVGFRCVGPAYSAPPIAGPFCPTCGGRVTITEEASRE